MDTRGFIPPGKYLTVNDVGGPTRFWVVGTEVAVRKDDGLEQLVLVLEGGDRQEKRLKLNKGNLRTIQGLFGFDDEAWRGQVVIIYVDHGVTFGGQVVGGLKLRAPDPDPADQRPAPRQAPDPRPSPRGAPSRAPEPRNGGAPRERPRAGEPDRYAAAPSRQPAPAAAEEDHEQDAGNPLDRGRTPF